MTLTKDEIGDEQYAKAQTDRMRFRGAPLLALTHARDRGALAVAHLLSLKAALDADLHSELARSRFAADAELCARAAFKGWRAYRLMKGD